MATPTQCDTCGSTDTDPKVHYGADTYHHDCLPHKVIRDLTTTGYWKPIFGTDQFGAVIVVNHEWVDGEEIPTRDLAPAIKRVLKYRKAAEGGTRGSRLLALITDDSHEKQGGQD